MIDADVHGSVPKADALFPYLAPVWVEYIQQSAFKGPADTSYPKGAPSTGKDATDVEALRQGALGEDVELAVMNCLYAVDSVHNPDSAQAMARAVNDWQAAEWLEKEPRLRASVVVPVQNPTMAAEEVRRAGRGKGFVQVLLPARTRLPLGDRIYRPILRAAVESGLAVGVHFGGSPGNPPTATGWQSTYVEEYAVMASVARAQLESMAEGGVFEELPALRVAVLECGWTWAPAVFRRHERLRGRVAFTTTPTHPPARDGVLRQVAEQVGPGVLMYSSDRPHVHAEEPAEIARGLGDEGVLGENARRFYGL